VAIIGVDNDAVYCGLSQPPLTSVMTNNHLLGDEAAKRMHERLTDARVMKQRVAVIAPVGVHARASTDMLAFEDADVAAAMRMIWNNATKKMSVDDIAEALNVSRSTLQRRFRESVGQSVHDAIMRRRLDVACRLLAETDLSLLAVAHQSGLAHQQYLGRLFRLKLGVTPADYRSKARRVRPAGHVVDDKTRPERLR